MICKYWLFLLLISCFMIQFLNIAIYPDHQRALHRKQPDFSLKLDTPICSLKQLTSCYLEISAQGVWSLFAFYARLSDSGCCNFFSLCLSISPCLSRNPHLEPRKKREKKEIYIEYLPWVCHCITNYN